MMRGQREATAKTALVQAERLELLLQDAVRRGTGMTREEVEAVAMLTRFIRLILRHVTGYTYEAEGWLRRQLDALWQD